MNVINDIIETKAIQCKSLVMAIIAQRVEIERNT